MFLPDPLGAASAGVAVFLDGAALARAWSALGERAPCRLDLRRLAGHLARRHGGAAAIHYVPAPLPAGVDPRFERGYHAILAQRGIRVELAGADLGALILLHHLAGGYDRAVVLTTRLASLTAPGPLALARPRGRGHGLAVHAIAVEASGGASGVVVDGGLLPPGLLPNCRLRPDISARPREVHTPAA